MPDLNGSAKLIGGGAAGVVGVVGLLMLQSWMMPPQPADSLTTDVVLQMQQEHAEQQATLDRILRAIERMETEQQTATTELLRLMRRICVNSSPDQRSQGECYE